MYPFPVIVKEKASLVPSTEENQTLLDEHQSIKASSHPSGHHQGLYDSIPAPRSQLPRHIPIPESAQGLAALSDLCGLTPPDVNGSTIENFPIFPPKNSIPPLRQGDFLGRSTNSCMAELPLQLLAIKHARTMSSSFLRGRFDLVDKLRASESLEEKRTSFNQGMPPTTSFLPPATPPFLYGSAGSHPGYLHSSSSFDSDTAAVWFSISFEWRDMLGRLIRNLRTAVYKRFLVGLVSPSLDLLEIKVDDGIIAPSGVPPMNRATRTVSTLDPRPPMRGHVNPLPPWFWPLLIRHICIFSIYLILSLGYRAMKPLILSLLSCS